MHKYENTSTIYGSKNICNKKKQQLLWSYWGQQLNVSCYPISI